MAVLLAVLIGAGLIATRLALANRTPAPVAAAGDATAAGDGGEAGPAEEARRTGESLRTEGDEGDVFNPLYVHVMPHRLGELDFGNAKLPYYDITTFQLIAVALMFVIFFAVRRGLEAAVAGRPMGYFARVFSGFVLFIRDDMVLPILGEKEGERFTPYFLFVFFFIAFMNLLGLVPHSRTATACIFVTGALAFTTLVLMIGSGMREQGAARFWKNLIPHGVPGWLVPLMFVVELLGLIVKPFALMIRLFANMMAGHLVVLSFMGLIFYFGNQMGDLAYAVAVPSVAMAVFIMIIEAFVALLQAYIFTYLSILFVGMCRHPEH